jgi:hypothetical protein
MNSGTGGISTTSAFSIGGNPSMFSGTNMGMGTAAATGGVSQFLGGAQLLQQSANLTSAQHRYAVTMVISCYLKYYYT